MAPDLWAVGCCSACIEMHAVLTQFNRAGLPWLPGSAQVTLPPVRVPATSATTAASARYYHPPRAGLGWSALVARLSTGDLASASIESATRPPHLEFVAQVDTAHSPLECGA